MHQRLPALSFEGGTGDAGFREWVTLWYGRLDPLHPEVSGTSDQDAFVRTMLKKGWTVERVGSRVDPGCQDEGSCTEPRSGCGGHLRESNTLDYDCI